MKCCPYFAFLPNNMDEIWNSRCPLKCTESLSVSWTAAQQMPQTNECSKSCCICTSHIYCPVWVKFSTWDLNILLFSIREFRIIGLRKTTFFVTSVNKMYLSVWLLFSISSSTLLLQQNSSLCWGTGTFHNYCNSNYMYGQVTVTLHSTTITLLSLPFS